MVALEPLGLGLGVAPLIVELLKANPEPVHAIRALNASHINECRQEFYRDLSFEVHMLRMTLTTLVRELSISEEEKSKLIDEKNLDAMVWKKPSEELRSALEERLGSCQDPFVQSMEKILHLLAKIVDDKSVPLTEHQIRVCKETSYEKLEELIDAPLTLAKKLRYGWTKEKRDRILQSLQKYNQRLAKMLKRSSMSSNFGPPQRRSAGGFVPDLGLRRMMSEFRKSIGRAWCRCVGKHEVRLGLSKTWKKEDHVRLDLLLDVSKESGKVHWGESKINIFLKESPPLTTVNLSSDRRGSATKHRRRSSNLTGTTFVESPKSSPGREFLEGSFRKNSMHVPSISSTSINDKNEATQNDRRPSESHRKVDDICKTVRDGQRVRRASQITLQENVLWHDTTTTEREVPHNHPGTSLDKILNSRKLKMKDRKILQVLLAQSVLFFPWTGQDLNKYSIALHQDLNKPFATILPDHSDDSMETLTDSLDDEALQPEWKPYDNEILAALATALLEIELEGPIEKMQIEDDLGDCGPGTFDSNFWTTTRIMKEKEDDMLQGCYGAIDACLRCDFEGHARTLDDPDLLQQVYERVVAPLERDLLTGFGIAMPFGAQELVKEASATTVTIALPSKISRVKKSVTTFDSPYLDEEDEEEVIFGGEFSEDESLRISPRRSGVSAIATCKDSLTF